jgi:hypothetical protein
MKHVKSLYIWWITVLIAATTIFWSYHSGLLMELWTQDHTHLTTIIGVLFLYATACTGYLAYNIRSLTTAQKHKYIGRCFFLSEVSMGLAILGASLAIILLLRIGLSTGDVTNFSKVLIEKWTSLGPAFYPNFVGLAVALYIKVQTYFIAEDYLHA